MCLRSKYRLANHAGELLDAVVGENRCGQVRQFMPIGGQFSVHEVMTGLESGDYTSVELTQALLDRIAAHDEKLNALLTVTGEEALAAKPDSYW